MKIVSVGYLPGPHYGHPTKFLENIRAFETAYPLLLYSFHDYGEGVLKIKADPEEIADGPNISPFAIQNFVNLTGFRIAKEHGADRVILLEPDVRVGDDRWDETINVGLESKPGALVGGSVIVHSPCNLDMEFARKWQDLIIANNSRKNFPIATYGKSGMALKEDPCVFVIGALGIYSMEVLNGAFHNLENTRDTARKIFVWDKHVGTYLFEKYRHACFDKVAHINSIYSSFGNVLTSEDERKAMLNRGDVVAVHQIKSDWTGPRPI